MENVLELVEGVCGMVPAGRAGDGEGQRRAHAQGDGGIGCSAGQGVCGVNDGGVRGSGVTTVQVDGLGRTEGMILPVRSAEGHRDLVGERSGQEEAGRGAAHQDATGDGAARWLATAGVATRGGNGGADVVVWAEAEGGTVPVNVRHEMECGRGGGSGQPDQE